MLHARKESKMLPKEKNKKTLDILNMLREKGAPTASPFPGEQDATGTTVDTGEDGVVMAAPMEKLPVPLKKNKKPLSV